MANRTPLGLERSLEEDFEDDLEEYGQEGLSSLLDGVLREQREAFPSESSTEQPPKGLYQV